MKGNFIKSARRYITAGVLAVGLHSAHAGFQILENFESYLQGVGNWVGVSSNGIGVNLKLSLLNPIEGSKQLNFVSVGVHLLGSKQTISNSSLSLKVHPLAKNFSFKYLDLLNVSVAKDLVVSFKDGIDGEVFVSKPLKLPVLSLGSLRHIKIPLSDFVVQTNTKVNAKLDEVSEVKIEFKNNLLSLNIDGNIDLLGFETDEEPNTTDLAIFKTGPDTTIQGNNFNYNLLVTNYGSITASDIVVTDELPSGVSYITSSVDSGTVGNSNSTVTANIPSLAAGASTTVRITVSANTVTTVQNSASVSFSGTDTNTSNNQSNTVSTNIIASSGNTAPTISVPGSQTVTINQSVTIPSVSVSDADSENVTLTASVSRGSLAFGNGAASNSITETGSVSSVNAKFATLKYYAPALSGADVLNFNANDGNASAVETVSVSVTEETVPPLEPTDLSISKVASSTSVDTGSSVTYTITYRNKGNVAAKNVVVTDMIPSGTTIVGVTGNTGGVIDATNEHMIITHSELAAGAVKTVYLTVQVADTAVGVIQNTVTIAADNNETAPSDNSATEPIIVDSKPSNCGFVIDANWPMTSSIHTVKSTKKGLQSKVKFGGPVIIANTGNVQMPKSLLKYYLSDDNIFDEADLLVGSKTVPKIKPAKSKKVKVAVKIPIGTNASGKYILVVMTPLNGSNDPCLALNRILVSSQISPVK